MAMHTFNILIAHRAAGQKVVCSQTTVDKSRGGKISFIVKSLNEPTASSYLQVREKMLCFIFHAMLLHLTYSGIFFNTTKITKITG
jgi:hypothetical protein